MNTQYDYIFKLVLVGNSSVGKTSFLTRFTDNVFYESFLSTIGVDFKLRSMEIKNKQVKLSIWDTAGQERFKTIIQNYYKGAHGIIFLYDITDSQSFDHIKNWVKEVRDISDDDTEMMLIGNKSDLQEQREVEQEQGIKLAEAENMMFLETSAKTAYNIDQTFISLTQKLMTKQMNLLEAQQKNQLNRPLNIKKYEDLKQTSNCC